MRPRPLGLAVVLSFIASPSLSLENVTFVTSLAYQDKELTFDQKYSGNDTNNAEFSVHLPMINATFTAAYDKWFATLKLEKNLSDIPTSTNETDRSLVDQANLIAVSGSEVDVGREDTTFTIGYNVWDSMNIFVGYLNGETELTPDPFCANPFADTQCSRTNRAFFQFFLEDNGFEENQPRYKQDYKEEGYYIGVSYAFRFEDVGTLSLSFAYADMEGEYKDNANDSQNAFADSETGLPTFVAFNYEGDATGTSIGATWTGSLGDSTAYFLDLRRQEYTMEGEDVTGLANFSGISLETEEEMVGITAGVQLYF